MEILTTRFGPVKVTQQDRIEFPMGMVGVPQQRRFVLIRDPLEARLLWLQSTRDPAWAFALVPPRSIDSTYQVRSTPEQLQTIQVASADDVDVYVTLSRSAGTVCANMQAPILINRHRRLGIQLVLSDARYKVRQFVNLGVALRKSA